MDKVNRGMAKQNPRTKKVTYDAVIGVKVRTDHAKALTAFCRRHQISVVALMREAALEIVRPGLGVGVAEMFGSYKRNDGPTVSASSVIPVKFTDTQHHAVVAHSLRHGLAPSTFLRESAMRYIGAVKVGAFESKR